MSTPEKCPKCGAVLFEKYVSGSEFKCFTLILNDGTVMDGNHCLRTQRDQLASQVAELADCLSLLHIFLQSWQADHPDEIGDKEPAAMATAASLIAKHKPTP